MNGSLHKQNGSKYWYLTIDMGKEKIGEKENGKPIYKRLQKKINTKMIKKSDAEKVRIETINQLNNNVFVKPEKLTFTEFLNNWLNNYVKQNCELTTYESYELIIKKHIIPYFKNEVLLQKLQPSDLQKYYNYLLENGRADGKGGLSANTVHKHHANIHKALDYALKMQLVVRNVADAVPLPQKQKYIGNYYTGEQIKILIEVVKNTPIETPVIITITLGLRRGEALGLKWNNINLNEGILRISESRVRFGKGAITKKPKNESSIRTMPIPEFLIKYLKQLNVRQKENKLMCGKDYKDNGYVCCHFDGSPLDLSYISHKFREILEINSLPLIRFHDLRHSNASYLLKQGVSMKEIQVWLGHKQLSTTSDIYSHVDMELKKNSANKINEIFKKINYI